ncbi:uncharacterized protein AAG666_007515 [Megaptera novaeangliae]
MKGHWTIIYALPTLVSGHFSAEGLPVHCKMVSSTRPPPARCRSSPPPDDTPRTPQTIRPERPRRYAQNAPDDTPRTPQTIRPERPRRYAQNAPDDTPRTPQTLLTGPSWATLPQWDVLGIEMTCSNTREDIRGEGAHSLQEEMEE